jgi:penicillin-binding protein 2
VMAKYPPGSLFKTVVALIGMDMEVIYPNHHFPCEMGYYYGGRLYGCHQHGPIRGVAMAIQHSCNAFFFRTIRKIVDKNGFSNPHPGLDTFNNYLYRFGLGRPLGIDFPQESAGNLPTSEYYDKMYPREKGGWRSPTIMSIGIGQGEIELSTMQMANLAAIMANRGHYFVPHLVKAFGTGEPISEKYRTPNYTGVDSIYFDHVVDGMARVVTSGTGYTAYIPDIPICGKTGTSQNPHGEDHSVFFAFAPKENPQIAIAVYVENGGWGTTYAAPIASLMIEKYIRREISKGRKWWEERMLNADLVSEP